VRAQQRDVKDRLVELTQDAVDRGVFGSPTFFVDRDMFFGKDRLSDVEDAIAKASMSAQDELKKSSA
jgi:2-hydroxychromene-2-carboxylate isomerase